VTAAEIGAVLYIWSFTMSGRSISSVATLVLLAVNSVMLAPTSVLAHTGVGPVHDLLHGLEHPLTGFDHIAAMLAVGLWAAQRGGRAMWLVPLCFVAFMTVGGALGMAGVSLPLVEPGIVLSLIVLGALVATGTRLPLGVSMAIVGLFAIAHGYAHGAEIPSAASGATYAAGFALATICLHAIGAGFGLLMQRVNSAQVVRVAGAAIGLCGVWLVLS
jgi:urease accessory protein